MTLVAMFALLLGLAFATARFGVDSRETRHRGHIYGSWVGLT